MSRLRIEFHNGGLKLPELNLWLDPHDPQIGPEKVFVSHAHSDHTAAHREVILSAPTARLMQARVPGKRHEHILEFGEARRFLHEEKPFDITLLPAGHIFGSAMSLIEADGESLLYTGDFKLRPGRSAERCEPRHADVVIMETTYGQPKYVFPAPEEVLKGVVRFCRETLDNDETAVLLGYSLGKSQEILRSLGEAGLPIMLHGTVYRLTQIYEQFGQSFPPYEKYDAATARGKVLLCPPNVVNSSMLRNLGKRRVAVLTGWAVDPNCRFRYQCDAAFPMSDHADFPDLIKFVDLVKPKMVYTLHGFAADFAQTLRQRGYEARALSQNEQLNLPITLAANNGSAKKFVIASPLSDSEVIVATDPGIQHPFVNFAEACSRIAGDPRKLEKIRFVAEYLRTLNGPVVSLAATWFSGRPFPSNQNKVLQLGWAVLRDALCEVAGLDDSQHHQIYLKHSDSGETAAEILQTNETPPTLSMEEVNDLFQRLHAARGSLAKTGVLVNTLRNASSLEGRYLVKIITGDLRIGLKEGLVEEAVAQAFGKTASEVRRANLLIGDIGDTAELAAKDLLATAKLTPFRPIKFMLASPEETANDILERVKGWSLPSNMDAQAGEAAATATATEPASTRTDAWIEDKYDGVRCQIHKVGQKVSLYSRDLKDITATFIDLADNVRAEPSDFVLDGEIVAMRNDAVLPFADLQKRLGRREGDLFMREEVPIRFVAFDLLWSAGDTLLDRPLSERRQLLERIVEVTDVLKIARITRAFTTEEIESAFTAARLRGNEGLMVKDPTSIYLPGRRGLSWLKLKKAFATLDCVVIGAEFGHGKRSKVLSDYTFAVRDETSGELKTIGKAYSGLTDVEIAQLTQHFKNRAIRQQGRYFEVVPDTVLEIAFDKIQESERHNSGLAMRFPRIARIRSDKSPEEIDTLATAKKLAGKH